VPAASQGADLGIEARRVGPGTVNEDDRWNLSSHARHRPLVDGCRFDCSQAYWAVNPSYLRFFETRRSQRCQIA